jgi:type II secretory pathway pseudopilin PulG
MKKAFTLIEVVISIGIIIVFAALVMPRYNDYNNELKLKKETRRIMSTIELAKKKALSSDLYNPSCTSFEGYRVEVAANSFTLHFMCEGAQQMIQSYPLDSNVSITTGTGNMDFAPIGANTSIPIGTIRLRNDSIGKCIDITVTPLGIVSTNDTLFAC